MRNLRKWVLRLLVASQLLLALLLLKNWLYVTTYRLYVEDRIDPSPQDGMVWQQFNIRDARVVPEIFAEGSVRLRFPLQFPNASTLWFGTDSTSRATYQIQLVRNGSRSLLYQHQVDGKDFEHFALSPGNGVLEISSDGPIVWSDLRIVHGWATVPYAVALGFVFLTSLLLLRGGERRSGSPSTRPRRVLVFMVASVAGSCLLTVVVLEAALQLLGAPAPLRTLRHDLGEISPDSRWEDSARYGSRLRPNQSAALQWRDGDIVRMGFIPPAQVSNAPGLYSLHTDSEGFRNNRVREGVHIAALGDSFTDGLTLPVEQIWTSRLEQILGLPVQNYGTAGFGPQQELYVLRDYAIRHHPRFVLVAFFAGNDIFNAESFDKYEKAEGSIALAKTGWSLEKVVPRYKTFYSFTLLRFAINTLQAAVARREPERAAVANSPGAGSETPDASGESTPVFARGMFQVPVNGRTLQFAFMPPYLQTLTLSHTALEKRDGWRLTRETILAMNQTSQESGATLVILFLPFKSQVYFPLLERNFSAEDLDKDFQFYFRQEPAVLDSKEMSKNRLAQNELMRQLCDEQHILLIDTTAALQKEVDSGTNMYFPDESHINAAGHQVVANTIAAFFKTGNR